MRHINRSIPTLNMMLSLKKASLSLIQEMYLAIIMMKKSKDLEKVKKPFNFINSQYDLLNDNSGI